MLQKVQKLNLSLFYKNTAVKNVTWVHFVRTYLDCVQFISAVELKLTRKHKQMSAVIKLWYCRLCWSEGGGKGDDNDDGVRIPITLGNVVRGMKGRQEMAVLSFR